MIVCLNGNILLAPSGPRQDDEEACLHISKCLLPFQVIFLEFVIFLQDEFIIVHSMLSSLSNAKWL